MGGLCPARLDWSIGGGGGRGSEESSKWGGQQKVIYLEAEVKGCWAVTSPSMGGSRGCCKGCSAAMAESRGWITLDPGLVHGGPGKHLVGNSALALSVQLEAGRGECLGGGHAWPVGGGWRACGWPGSLEEVPKPWGLVGDRAECLISQLCTSSKFATTSWYWAFGSHWQSKYIHSN